MYDARVRTTRPQEIIATQVIGALKARRDALGWSQRALARKAGIDPKTVNLIERGVRNPTLHTLLLLASAMEQNLWPLLRNAELGEP